MTARRRGEVIAHLGFALVAYVPTLWSAPGRVGADTKTYLYLDPARLLARAPYLWDRHVGFGTVTHQTIGYLWPMGPWYWLFERGGVPDWVAQRLWLGTLLFAAAAGVMFLLRTVERPGGWSLPARVVAAAAYALSPYLLDYSARISVILLPWAALPWLIGIVVRAARQGGWRWPAVFALVVATVGGVNATALVLAGLGPALWLTYTVGIERSVTARRALAAVGRIGVLTIAVSLWWIAGLWAQGRYGIPILRYTETYETVARTATAPELLRGLGYWFFYGSDKLGPWIEPGSMYTSPLLVALGYGLVAAALLAAAAAGWAHRRAAVALVVVGLVVAVGAHPYDSPTVYGRLFKAFAATTPGAALRSTPRAAPLVVLGMALLLGAGVDAVERWWPQRAPAAARRRVWLPAVAATLLVVANQPPLLVGRLYGDNLQRPEEIPAYWRDAAAAMSAGDRSTRVLEVPGSDFASYRWGNTVDPITPGLSDRDVVARELIPYGSAPSADLLNAIDRRFQEGIYEPSSLAPLARLTSSGTVALRADLQYERFRTPRPRRSWLELAATPGLDSPSAFGAAVPNLAIEQFPLIDEVELGLPAGAADPPPVALFPVDDPVSVLHAAPAGGAVIYAGDGEGIVDMAAAGLLDDAGAVVASAGLAGQPALLDATLAASPPATVVVTDTNRRAARRWGTVRDNLGYTEAAGEEPLVDDPTDNRLDVYADADGDAYHTVAELGGAGVAAVQATAYGNPVSYTPEDRPAAALDGDVQTAWRVGAFADVRGERLVVHFDSPVTTSAITLLQPVTGPRNRWLTEVRVRLGTGSGATDAMDVALDDSSRAEPGQWIELGGERTFTELEVEVVATNIPPRPGYGGLSGVGIAELDVAGRRVVETVRLPTDLLAAAGNRAADHPLAIVATRWRVDPAEPVRTDPETHLARRFELPGEREFTVAGTARVSAAAPAPTVDAVLGRFPAASPTSSPSPFVSPNSAPAAEIGDTNEAAGDAAAAVVVVGADANQSLPGELRAGPAAAADGDPATAWTTPFVFVTGTSATVTVGAPIVVDHLDLVVVDDGRHSVPSELAITADDGAPVVVPVPAPTGAVAEVTPAGTPPARAGEQATRSVRVELPQPLSGTSFTFTITGIDAVEVNDYYAASPVPAPVGIAEWGMPGVTVAPVKDSAPLPSGCRDDLVTIDGELVPVRVLGSVGDGLDRDALDIEGCDAPLRLAAGDHELRTALGRDVGIDVDRLVLLSGSAPAAPAAPTVTVLDEGPVSYKARAAGTGGRPFWVVLGQSHNDGWTLSVDGDEQGAPVLIDGYANGWLVTPAASADTLDLDLTWAPQRTVWRALWLSAAGVLVCVLLAVWPRRRRTAEHRSATAQHTLAATPLGVGVAHRDGCICNCRWVRGGGGAAHRYRRGSDCRCAPRPAGEPAVARVGPADPHRNGGHMGDCGERALSLAGRLRVAHLLRPHPPTRLVGRGRRRRARLRPRLRPRRFHRQVTGLGVFLSTAPPSHNAGMAYVITFADDTKAIELIEGADAYLQEGPLTTFFRTSPGRTVVDSWSTRLASFRTADIRSVKLVG